mgnify:CR=1 FL=1
MYRDFQDIIFDAQETYQQMQHRIDSLQDTLREWNKDAEITKANKKAEYYREHSLLTLSDKEMKDLNEFRNRHFTQCALPLNKKITGNKYIYTLTGTGFGTIIEVTCPICGATADITDTASW